MLQIRYPSGRDPEWTYILHVVFNDYLGIPYEAASAERDNVEIRLAEDPAGRTLHITAQLLNTPDAQWLKPASLPARPLVRMMPAKEAPALHAFPDPLPILYGTGVANGSYVVTGQDSITLGIDVFGSAFFMLTRYEEFCTTERDNYRRFPPAASLAVREGFHRIPIVQEYLEILWTCMTSLWPGITRVERAYRVVLTHDVDSPSSRSWPAVSVLKHVVGDLTLRKEPELALRRSAGLAYDRIVGRSPSWDVLNTFSFLMGSAEQFGLSTVFNFLPYRSPTYNDASYSVDDPPARELLRTIRMRGHSVGYHASFKAFDEPAILRSEFAELRRVSSEEGIVQKRWGGRHHFLKWTNPDTWQSWDDAGLEYDSSLGFNDDVGFRCGCCFEFPVFNLVTRRMLRLREQPLVFMDVALIENRRMPANGILDAMRMVSNACKRCRGDLVVLWHNTSVVGLREKRMYLDILSEIA
jgi:hypothetical protein